MERDDEDGGSPSCSDVGPLSANYVKKIMEKELEPMVKSIVGRVIKPMVISIVQQEIVPVAEDLVRRVVKEVIQPVEEKLLNGETRNGMRLKFLDDVSDAMTGEELKGVKDGSLRLALLDSDGNIVTCGHESSAKVEILLLHANENDGESSMTHEIFERSIIETGENKKPHFAKAKSVCISLEKGVADLSGLKLGHDKDRIKLCSCRLGARILQNLGGVIVPEAWTAPFKVIDKRDKFYDKHCPPRFDSEVWRLEEIGKSGEPCKRLERKNIKILRDFQFWFHVNPEGLKQILEAGDRRWKTIVDHAQTCINDDERMYSHESSTEPQMRVVYDAVGNLKGEIIESHFVPINNLSADRKVRARELLRSLVEDESAFGERYHTSFSNEDALLKEFPYRSCDPNASTNSSLQGSSSQSIVVPNNLYGSAPCGSLGSREMGELCNPASAPFPDPQITGGGPLADLDYDRHENPSPFDEVSRLCNDGEISASGCIGDNRVSCVEDFMNHDSSQTSMLSDELLASASINRGRNIRPYNDMQHSTGLGGGASGRMVGESSSGLSNASFHSAMSVENREWFDDDYEYCIPPPSSPNPMLHFYDDILSYNTRPCGDETWPGHEGSAAVPQVVDPPKGWKRLLRLWNSFKERVSIDVGCSNKKRKVG